MKKKITFNELLEQNGFHYTGTTSDYGGFIYEREWRRTSEVVWHGEMEFTYRIEAHDSMGTPIIRLFDNGRLVGVRDYSSPKRAINAMREILRCAGYTL